MHNQFINLYGQRGARLNHDQSIHGIIVNPGSWFLKAVSPLIFWGADVHLAALEKIWVDRLVDLRPWTYFINKLNEEWQEFIIIVKPASD